MGRANSVPSGVTLLSAIVICWDERTVSYLFELLCQGGGVAQDAKTNVLLLGEYGIDIQRVQVFGKAVC